MKRFFNKQFFIAILVSLTSISAAHGAEISFRISNDTIGGGFEGGLGESSLVGGFEHFYKDTRSSVNISNLNFHTKGQTAIANMPTTVMLGLQAAHIKEGKFKGQALALGGNVRVNIPSSPGLSTELRLHYAPDIVAYGDSDRYTHIRGQLNYRIIESADISAGYQYLNTGIKSSDKDRTFESGLFVGLRLSF